MSALSVTMISDYLRHKDPARRLVITPLLDPAGQLKPNQAAIDVRLGRAFSLVKPWTRGVAEMLPASPGSTPTLPLETIVLEYGEPLIVHPHQFVLARTLEIVRLPDDLLSYVIGRSSWGRRGLLVATAVVIHPGFSGPVTLELKNVGEVPLALYPMDRIAQLTFHTVSNFAGAPSTESQFTSSFVPELGSVRDAETESRVAALARNREPS
jgi:dCTP deaminase